MRDARDCKSAFTLIELLIVIAIISVLSAVLLPALGAAREKAKASLCVSNLKELGLAVFMYISDNDGYYPPAASDIYTTNLRRWHGVRKNTTSPFDPSKGPLFPYLKTGEIKKCPSFRDFVTGNGAFEQGTGGYGYNQQYLGGSPERDPDKAVVPAKDSQIKNPSETIMFSDSAFLSGMGEVIEYSFVEAPYREAWPSLPPDPSTHFRHSGCASTLFCDGHVESRSMKYVHGIFLPAELLKAHNLGFAGRDNTLYDRQ
jgi:prepilin-type N-terminal cleavage/methylation domain-containing protein/prepilin-type processing-associated H-X9-DG protein